MDDNLPKRMDEVAISVIQIGALWCSPCVQFQKVLIESQEDAKDDDLNFECFQLSNDENKADFEKQIMQFPFPACQYDENFAQLDKDTPLSKFLKIYNIDKLPMVIVFDRGDQNKGPIEINGRNVIQKLKGQAFHKWVQESTYSNKQITDKVEEGNEDAPADDNDDN